MIRSQWMMIRKNAMPGALQRRASNFRVSWGRAGRM